MQQIIFINRYFYPDLSATSQMLSDLVFGLNKSNCEIHIVASRQRYDDAKAVLASSETINGIVVHRVWTSRFGRQALLGRAADYFTFYLSAAVSLLKITRAGAIIVAKTDPPLISIVAAAVAAIKSARLINWLQDLFPEVAAELGIKVIRGPVYKVIKHLRNFTLKRAEKNIVLGYLMAQRLEREGISLDKLAIIPNWADGRQIRPILPSENPLRATWGLEHKFVVGYSGNLGRSHDFLTILEAAGKLSDDPDIVFLFIGAGAQLGSVREQTQALSLSNIEFRPYQPRSELANSLSVPDVHLISLKPELEGLIVPSKFYGIAAAGRPTIFIGDLDGEISGLLKEYECGIAVRQGDASALAAEIRSLKGNPERMRRLAEKARVAFDTHFDMPVAISEWSSQLRLNR